MKATTRELLEILKRNKSIYEYLAENSEDFLNISLKEWLNNYVQEKKLKKADIVKASNLNEQYAYQIFRDEKLKPSRNKLLQLAFGMGLELENAQIMLRISGNNELYPKFERDSVIIYSLVNKLSLVECNEILFDLGYEILE